MVKRTDLDAPSIAPQETVQKSRYRNTLGTMQRPADHNLRRLKLFILGVLPPLTLALVLGTNGEASLSIVTYHGLSVVMSLALFGCILLSQINLTPRTEDTVAHPMLVNAAIMYLFGLIAQTFTGSALRLEWIGSISLLLTGLCLTGLWSNPRALKNPATRIIFLVGAACLYGYGYTNPPLLMDNEATQLHWISQVMGSVGLFGFGLGLLYFDHQLKRHWNKNFERLMALLTVTGSTHLFLRLSSPWSQTWWSLHGLLLLFVGLCGYRVFVQFVDQIQLARSKNKLNERLLSNLQSRSQELKRLQNKLSWMSETAQIGIASSNSLKQRFKIDASGGRLLGFNGEISLSFKDFIAVFEDNDRAVLNKLLMKCFNIDTRLRYDLQRRSGNRTQALRLVIESRSTHGQGFNIQILFVERGEYFALEAKLLESKQQVKLLSHESQSPRVLKRVRKRIENALDSAESEVSRDSSEKLRATIHQKLRTARLQLINLDSNLSLGSKSTSKSIELNSSMEQCLKHYHSELQSLNVDIRHPMAENQAYIETFPDSLDFVLCALIEHFLESTKLSESRWIEWHIEPNQQGVEFTFSYGETPEPSSLGRDLLDALTKSHIMRSDMDTIIKPAIAMIELMGGHFSKIQDGSRTEFHIYLLNLVSAKQSSALSEPHLEIRKSK